MPNHCTANQCLTMQYSFDLTVGTCIDQCECRVYAKPQGGGFLNEYWSNSCSFSIGPSGMILVTGYSFNSFIGINFNCLKSSFLYTFKVLYKSLLIGHQPSP